jgi:hypothetical protein
MMRINTYRPGRNDRDYKQEYRTKDINIKFIADKLTNPLILDILISFLVLL